MPDDTGRAITVLGEVNSSDLGVVMIHEHIQHGDELFEPLYTPYGREIAEQPLDVSMFGTLWRYPLANRDNVTFGRDDGIAEELARFEAAGGGTAVEMTCVGLSPDPDAVAQISQDSGVHIVMGCGYFVDGLLPDSFDALTVDQLADGLVQDITVGINGTQVRAGIIGEVGTSPVITEREERSLRASARAALRTGVAINIHLSHSVCPGAESHDAVEPGFSALDILESEGVPPSRVICGHLDEAQDADYAARLIDRGCVVGYDTFGTEWYWDNWKTWEPHDSRRVADVAELCRRGLHDSIVLSQDVAFKRQLRRHGGLGYDHLLVNIVPMLEDAGVTDQQLRAMLTETPRRLLTVSRGVGP
ncbi:MAG TPA: hypothetical protein VIW24_31540 [Aldersonia sp.]